MNLAGFTLRKNIIIHDFWRMPHLGCFDDLKLSLLARCLLINFLLSGAIVKIPQSTSRNHLRIEVNYETISSSVLW